MNELFVPYQQSLDMKELGFDEPCFGIHFKEGLNPFLMFASQYGKEGASGNGGILAPTFSQAFKFFREKYGLRNSIMDFIDDETGIEWDYEIAIIGTDLDEKGNYIPLVDYSTDDETRKFKTYEEAELACIIKLIELTKSGSLKA